MVVAMESAKRVLFVEDDVLIARIYCPMLQKAGFEVLVAEDGLIAMKQLKDFKPDLVVLDLMIPKLNGLDVLKFIRQDGQLRSIPVIVFSNGFLQNLWEDSAALGVQEMVLKSAATPAVLIATIRRILSAPVSVPEANPEAGSIERTAEARTRRTDSVSGFRQRIRRDFFEQIPAITRGLHRACGEFLDAPKGSGQLLGLEDLQRKVGFLTHMTGMAGCYRIAQLSSAFEALLFELHHDLSLLSTSARRTIAATVGLLADGLARSTEPDEQCLSPTSVLVVEDDAVSSRALLLTLTRANLKATALPDPCKALERLRENQFDIVLLDINLPGMTGIALCEEMRKLARHAQTPVIFMTSYAEFEPRARSILKGGDDLIAKPIMPVELTVKVVAQLLKHRLQIVPSPA
jgi:CheY-like chemotaxis protein